MNEHLKALCLEILQDHIGSERFTFLLRKTGIPLDTVEWDIANRILEKGDGIRSALGLGRLMQH